MLTSKLKMPDMASRSASHSPDAVGKKCRDRSINRLETTREGQDQPLFMLHLDLAGRKKLRVGTGTANRQGLEGC